MNKIILDPGGALAAPHETSPVSELSISEHPPPDVSESSNVMNIKHFADKPEISNELLSDNPKGVGPEQVTNENIFENLAGGQVPPKADFYRDLDFPASPNVVKSDEEKFKYENSAKIRNTDYENTDLETESSFIRTQLSEHDSSESTDSTQDKSSFSDSENTLKEKETDDEVSPISSNEKDSQSFVHTTEEFKAGSDKQDSRTTESCIISEHISSNQNKREKGTEEEESSLSFNENESENIGGARSDKDKSRTVESCDTSENISTYQNTHEVESNIPANSNPQIYFEEDESKKIEDEGLRGQEKISEAGYKHADQGKSTIEIKKTALTRLHPRAISKVYKPNQNPGRRLPDYVMDVDGNICKTFIYPEFVELSTSTESEPPPVVEGVKFKGYDVDPETFDESMVGPRFYHRIKVWAAKSLLFFNFVAVVQSFFMWVRELWPKKEEQVPEDLKSEDEVDDIKNDNDAG